MKKIFSLVAGIALLSIATQALASADYSSKEKGWHKGFYFLTGVGMMNVDEDTNVVNNQAFGSDNIMGYGLTWGWNFLDHWAAELQTRYGTEKVGARREHAANININAKYSFIIDALTSLDSARFLPYIKVGGGIFGAAVPDTSVATDRLGVFGPSLVLGGGMEILLAKMLYVGFDFTEDLVFLQEKNRGATRIINGGFDPQYSFFGNVGVHF